MNNTNNILDNTKVLSITNGNAPAPSFVSEVETEVESLKLKYYMWLSRLFILFAVLSTLFLIAASLVIFKLAPQVTVEPFLIIKQDASDSIVRSEPITQDMASKKQLMEMFLKQYVILRNTFINDPTEMQSRWFPGGMVNFMSSWDVYRNFHGRTEEGMNQALSKKTVREVEIISIGKLGGEKSSVWKVDFKTYDLSEENRDPATKAMLLKVSYWTVSITAYFIPFRSFVSLRLINPLGFTVTRYSQTEVNIY